MSKSRTLRAMLPRATGSALARWLVALRDKRLARLFTEAVFDEIYRLKMWQGGRGPSDPDSQGRWSEGHAAYVPSLIRQLGARTPVDLGCGDFEVGQRLLALAERYIGIEVSRVIGAINQRCWDARLNVEFNQVDIPFDPPRQGDLILVGQVLI